MPDICEYCEGGGFWDCGPDGTRCQGANEPQEDRCHYFWVLLKEVNGCCKARLWLPGIPVPPGWRPFRRVPIRIQTLEIQGECVARVYVPDLDCKEFNQRCEDEAEYTVDPTPQVIVNVNVSPDLGVQVYRPDQGIPLT